MRGVVFTLLASSLTWAQSPWVDDCGLEEAGAPPPSPVPRKTWEPPPGLTAPPTVRRDSLAPVRKFGGLPAPTYTNRGALAGKTVYLSPGHGFTWTQIGTDFFWRTQRPNTNQIVEDLVSIETLNQLLVPYLLQAGAEVVSVREIDLNPALVIVDDKDVGYQEVGSGFQDSTLKGFSHPTLPMDGDVLPFALGTNRLMDASQASTSQAAYTATLPSDGFYNVSISYTAYASRVKDAHYVVHHAGGETHFRVNQQRHGSTWVLLGRFFFKASRPAKVIVLNDSAAGSGNISLDAVRFGGGMGLINRGGGVSGRPRFEESARYHSQFSGAPPAVWAPSNNAPEADRNNDVGTRSRFAAWVHEPGEDAVYVAWHTNALDGSAVGTSSYIYGPAAPVVGSDRLAQLIQAELVGDIRAPSGWNQPSWRNRGVISANFGELNPANNSEMPAVLVEVAFHDAAADAMHLKEPGFRSLAARAFAQGIIKYFAEKDGVPALLPPEPPVALSAINAAGTASLEALIRWNPSPTDTEGVRGQPAARYRVYASDDGLAWDNGLDVESTSARVALAPRRARYFRVTALNDGGESFPSAVVGVRAPDAGKPLVLVINGYERLDATLGEQEVFESSQALGTVLRIVLARMNDGTYVRLQGDAFAANDVGFDAADADALVAGTVAFDAYDVIAYFAGRGRQSGTGPTAQERALLQAASARGQRILFSGDAAQSPDLVSSVFSALVSSSVGSLSVAGGNAWAGFTASLDDGHFGTYDTGSPSTLSPSGAAEVLAGYSNGAGAAVGVPRKSICLGFPLETVVEGPQRTSLIARALSYLQAPAHDAGVGTDAGTGIDAGHGESKDGGQVAHDGGAQESVDGGGPPIVLRVHAVTVGCSLAPPGPSALFLAGVLFFICCRRRPR